VQEIYNFQPVDFLTNATTEMTAIATPLKL